MKLNKNYIKRVLIACIGGVFLGIGVSLFVKSSVGLDPMSIWVDGIANTLGISFGQASILNTFIQIIVAVTFARKNVNVGTITSALIVGPIIEWLLPVLYTVIGPENSILMTVILFILGQVFIAIAIAILVGAKAGMALLDAVIFKIMELVKKDYKTVKMTIDGLYIITGFLLGGKVGWGTILAALIGGPLQGFMIGQAQIHVFSKMKMYQDDEINSKIKAV